MKSFTNVEQSKKLAEFLPLESADMHYWKRTWKENDYAISVGHSKELQEGFETQCIEYIPCWSIAALLDVLPNDLGLLKCFDDGLYYCVSGQDDTSDYNNPVDACYEMIIKLHEQKLL